MGTGSSSDAAEHPPPREPGSSTGAQGIRSPLHTGLVTGAVWRGDRNFSSQIGGAHVSHVSMSIGGGRPSATLDFASHNRPQSNAAIAARVAEEQTEMVWSDDSDVSEGERDDIVGELKDIESRAAGRGRVLKMISSTFHIVLCVDFSKSMAKADVDGSRRIDAVLAACNDFVALQRAVDVGSRRDVYSMLTFNQSARVLFKELSIQQAEEFINVMHLSSSTMKPTGPTRYREAFQSIAALLREAAIKDARVLFLSDGRPHENTKVLDFFNLEFMGKKKPWYKSLVFHTIGFGEQIDEGMKEYLLPMARKTNGAFHHSSLSVLDLGRVFTCVSSSITSTRSSSDNPLSKVERDGDLVMQIPFDDVPSTAPCEMKCCISFARKSRSTAKGVNVYEETIKCEEAYVTIDRLPFDRGGMRCVYRMTDTWDKNKDQQMVAKRLIRRAHATVEDHLPFCKCAGLAYSHVKNFVKECKEVDIEVAMNFVPCYLYKYQHEGKEVAFLGEQMLQGNFIKFNGNNGYIESKTKGTEVMQAFSHYTFVSSQARHIVVDVQGVVEDGKSFWLTDPQIHSRSLKVSGYGPGDLGFYGIQLFFESHVCGETCRKLRLQQRQNELKGRKPPSASKRTCVICMDEETTRETVFKPCGHSLACEPCAIRLINARMQCPTCRQAVLYHELGKFSTSYVK